MIDRAGLPLALIPLLVLLASLLLLAVAIVWRRRASRLARPARHRLLSAADLEFESDLQRGLRHQGYIVESSSGEFLAIRRGGETTLVSFIDRRRMRKTRARVDRLQRAMALQGAAGGKFVTTFYISKRLQQRLADHAIEWLGPNELAALVAHETARDVARDKREWVTSFTPDPGAEVESAAITGRLAETPECARCGSSMHLETASTGNASGQRYWRCDRAPACRGIRPL